MNDIMPKVARLAVLALLGYAAGVAPADGPWQITTLEDGYGFSSHTSIGELPGGYPIISYYDSVDGDLECAWFDGSVWHTTTVDSTGWVGEYNRLAVFPIDDPTRPGQPAIAYYDRTNGRLMYAERDPADPNVWHKVAVDQEANEDTWCSLAILPSGRPAISYGNDGSLKYAECVSGDCLDSADWCMAVVDTGGTLCNTDLAVFPADHPDPTLRGRPAISYHDNDAGILKFAWRQARNPNETPDVCDPNDAWHTTIVDQAGQTGDWTSLMVFPADHPTWPGQPAIAYRRATNEDLMYAWHEVGTALDTGWHPTLVDDVGTAGWGCSVAMLPGSRTSYSFDGTRADLALQPVISYIRDGGLRFAWLDKTNQWHNVWVGGANGWQETSLAIPAGGPWAGEPVVSFFCNSDLAFARHDGFGWLTPIAAKSWQVGGTDSAIQTSGPNAGQPLVCYSMSYPNYELTLAERDSSNVWHKSTVTVGGWWATMAILPSGQPAEAHAWYGLQYEERDASGAWHWTPIDSAWGYMSMAVDPCTGQPAISYTGYDDLKFAWRDDLGTWHYDIVDSEGNVGYWTSLAFFPPDHPTLACQPAISYFKEYPDYDLKFAWHDPSDGWHTTTIDGPGFVGECTSLAILPLSHPTYPGQPVISYYIYDYGICDLRFAWHQGNYDLGSGWGTVTVDDDIWVGTYGSLALLPSGQPAIIYRDDWYNRLKYAWHEGSDFVDPNSPTTPHGWHRMIADSAGDPFFTGLVILPDGQPAVSYTDADHWDIKYAEAIPADVNCDGVVDFGDINPFVLALTSTPPDYTQYYDAYPNCPRHLADINGDGTVDFGDINPFVALLSGNP